MPRSSAARTGAGRRAQTRRDAAGLVTAAINHNCLAAVGSCDRCGRWACSSLRANRLCRRLMRIQLMRIVAAVVLIAAFAVPSLARAHDGHAHHGPGAAQATPAAPDMTRTRHARAERTVASRVAVTVALSTARNSATGAAGVVTACGGSCCGDAAGMACCGAALAPEPFCIPLLHVSASLAIPRAPPLPGLPPEALPKPPKSIA